ncbi:MULTISPECIES: hypothetical protein [Candidatus Ichthyocystis]|nr:MULTISPECIES: hypothetical protein [Ichthyocystis]
MFEVSCFSPCTLLELSMKSVFGIKCKESIDILMQLSRNEIIDAAILVKRGKMSFSMYDNICDDVPEDYDAVYPFPDDWVDFCKDNCSLSNNPIELGTLLGFMSKINFIDSCVNSILGKDRSKVLSVIAEDKVTEVPSSMIFMFYIINSLLDDLKTLRFRRMGLFRELPLQLRNSVSPISLIKVLRRNILGKYDKLLWYLTAAASLQLKHSFSLLGSSVDCDFLCAYFMSGGAREVDRMDGIVADLSIPEDIVNDTEDERSFRSRATSCLNEFISDVEVLGGTILPVIHVCNFLPLEDMMEMFKRKGSLLCKKQIDSVCSLLRRKYLGIIRRKKLRVGVLIEKIKQSKEVSMDENNLSPVSLSVMNKSVIRLRNEVRSMELLLSNFYEIK